MSISYQSLDLETEKIVASLILQDLQGIQDAQKGKRRADAPMSDDQLALQDQLAAIMSHMSILEDIHIARNLDDALRLDRDCLEVLSIINRAEREDHDAALALGRGEALPPPSEAQTFLQDRSVITPQSVPLLVMRCLIDQTIRDFVDQITEARTVISSTSDPDEADSLVTLAPESIPGSSTSLRLA
jgi:hypothetical protein